MHAFDNGAAQRQQEEWKRNMIASGQLPDESYTVEADGSTITVDGPLGDGEGDADAKSS